MKVLIYIFLLLSVASAKAQDLYDAVLIPKALLPYANTVVRSKEVAIIVKDLNNTIYHVREAVTILNKNGDENARIVVEHDKINIIKNIKGTVYNEFGKQIGKFSESDFDDISAGHNFSLFEDTRIKHYLPSVAQYPYTIVYEYETRSKQSLNFDKWEPNPSTGVAVEKSLFTFTCKPDFKIHIKETNIQRKGVENTNPDGTNTYSWQVSNLMAGRNEPFSPYHEQYQISVQIAPEQFTYYGIGGTFRNWKELGKWEYDKLVATRQDLPPETISHIRDITKNINDPKLKARAVYEFMQAKTHYISVQVGIGGYQPFLASDVDRQNYGDCKALVNYTQALLKAVDISSYYCVVQSGRNYKVSLLDDFASMEQGNHIILCLPFKNDTTWCDCTSQTIPFGYLGDFTDDRLVLACTPDGGKLMHTPKYAWKANLESRKANFIINENSELSGEMATTFKGTDYEDRDYLMYDSRVEQIKMLQHQYPINNMEIESLDYSQDKSLNPVTTEKVKLHARDFASVSDGKYYFMLNPVNRIAEPPRIVRNRINPVYINRGFTDEDEITYTIPTGYHLEKVPLDIAIDKPYGKFKANMLLKGNHLVYKRTLELINGTYSKDTYPDLVDFYQDIADADSYNVVLVK